MWNLPIQAIIFDLVAYRLPDFGLVIVDQTEVFVGIYRKETLAGVLKNDSTDAVEWASEVFECCRENAVNVVPLDA